MSDLEKNIMDKRFSFSVKDMKWVISTLIIGISWIITIVLWVQDKNKQKSRIEVLETKNSALELRVAALNGEISGVNQVTKVFMEYPPSESRFRIELLEKRVDKIENISGVQVNKTIENTPAPIKRNIR